MQSFIAKSNQKHISPYQGQDYSLFLLLKGQIDLQPKWNASNAANYGL